MGARGNVRGGVGETVVAVLVFVKIDTWLIKRSDKGYTSRCRHAVDMDQCVLGWVHSGVVFCEVMGDGGECFSTQQCHPGFQQTIAAILMRVDHLEEGIVLNADIGPPMELTEDGLEGVERCDGEQGVGVAGAVFVACGGI